MNLETRKPFPRHLAWGSACALSLVFAASLHAQRNLKDIPVPDTDAELAAFELHEGFEISLFAGDPLVQKPIQMNFDSEGRLWVVSSPLYPHIAPGEVPADRVLVLEDENGDGVADISRVFAEGLLMPTGIEPGDGGVYVANSTEVLFLKDTDGDGRADFRRTMLSGFGTEDTHHLIHTFRWGHDGYLYFNQSIYIHSHIETPWGVRRMNGGGVWQFRTDTLELEPFVWGMCNGWGHHFDRYGQSLGADGAGFDGVQYFLPGCTMMHSPRRDPVLRGLNVGSPKYCGGEVVSGRHLPDDWQGNFITNDFRAHRVVRYAIEDDGAGFAARQLPDVLKSRHRAFRPIDVKGGPDGAIYIADWYNPIIQHGEVGFRDERRDHTHGRIWRLRAVDRPLVERPRLTERTEPELLTALASPESWTRHFARRVLSERPRDRVLGALEKHVAGLSRETEGSDELALETLWVYQTLREPNRTLLETCLNAREPRVRTAAVRVLADWIGRIEDPVSLLSASVADPFPRARLESVRALARIREPRSVEIATSVLEQPMDAFLDYALKLTIRQLAPVWLPALEEGAIDFGGSSRQLEYAFAVAGSPAIVGTMLARHARGEVPLERAGTLFRAVARLGDAKQLSAALAWAVEVSGNRQADTAEILDALSLAARSRKVVPDSGRDALLRLLEDGSPRIQEAAAGLAGAWRDGSARGQLQALVAGEPAVAEAARSALVALGGEASFRFFRQRAEAAPTSEARARAAAAMVPVDTARAVAPAVALLASSAADSGLRARDAADIFRAFLGRAEGAKSLAKGLRSVQLSEDLSRVGLREILASGREHAELARALRQAAGLKDEARSFDAAARGELLDAVVTSGDAERGEAIYRREGLRCLSCHAIGGSGGKVGPDLTSIGGSAQLDYLLDSLIEPNKAVKENYGGVVVVTAMGEVLTGIKVRQGEGQLVLRTVDDVEVTLGLDQVLSQQEGKSIMPSGLIDGLTEGEIVDLVSFLSALGKETEFSVGTERVVRTWRVLQNPPAAFETLTAEEIAVRCRRDRELEWVPAYSRVSGELPMATASGPTQARTVWLRFSLEVTTPGETVLRARPTSAVESVLIDGKEVPLKPALRVGLSRGVHDVYLRVARDAELRVELGDVAGSPARVKLLGGS